MVSNGSLYSLLGACSEEKAFEIYAVLWGEVLFSFITSSLLLCRQVWTYTDGGGMFFYLPFQVI